MEATIKVTKLLSRSTHPTDNDATRSSEEKALVFFFFFLRLVSVSTQTLDAKRKRREGIFCDAKSFVPLTNYSSTSLDFSSLSVCESRTVQKGEGIFPFAVRFQQVQENFSEGSNL